MEPEAAGLEALVAFLAMQETCRLEREARAKAMAEEWG
jgi:hypothetical protein